MERPITFKEARERNRTGFPDKVIEAFNELILENIDYEGTATFLEEDVIVLMVTKGLKREDILNKGWLRAYLLFREGDWCVGWGNSEDDDSSKFRFTFKKLLFSSSCFAN